MEVSIGLKILVLSNSLQNDHGMQSSGERNQRRRHTSRVLPTRAFYLQATVPLPATYVHLGKPGETIFRLQ